MGCASCVNIKKDKDNEMNNGNMSNKNMNDIKKKYSSQETLDSEYLNKNQIRNNDIFDFFIDLRANPGKYIEESKKYELDDIIISANDKKLYQNKRMIILNSFFNLFLDSSVHKFPDSKESILSDLENVAQLKDYEKSLFCVKSSFENPKDFVWCLLKENKEIALDEILYKNYDFFIVSSNSFSNEIIVYFLFLKKI